MALNATTLMRALETSRASFNGRLVSPYQHEGVKWMLCRELTSDAPGGLLCDEMGLGKTIQMIATILGNPQPKTLVVVPKAVLMQWNDAFRQFAGIVPRIVKAADVATADVHSDGVILTTYSVFMCHGDSDFQSPFTRIMFDRIVLDEAHVIKNQKSKIHRVMRLVDGKIKWALTGTPIARSEKDFEAMLSYLGVMDRLRLRELAEKFILRRTKEDVARIVERLRLPPLQIDLVRVTLSEEERAMYDDLKRDGQVMYAAHQMVGGGMMAILEVLLRMRQAVTNPQLVLNGVHKKTRAPADPVWETKCSKLDALKEELTLQPAHEKTLIFCHWTSEMDTIESMVADGMHRRTLRLEGGMNVTQRDEVIKLFRENRLFNTLIVQIDAGGVGLNLQMATRVYINSLHWNATAELQAISRAHRQGQTQSVVVKRLVADDTIDSYIMKIQDDKLKTAAVVLADSRIVNALNTQNLATLIASVFGPTRVH